ncbi:hypothetical protein AAFF27_26730 [Xylophilus sp. GW821-FHT01B05]
MSRSRRSFLQSAGAVPVAAATGFAATPALAAGAEMRRSHFMPLVGEHFGFARDGLPAAGATLVSATPLPGAADTDRCFQLLFAVGAGQQVVQDSWLLSHPRLGSHTVFVSPNDAEGRSVEAVFNRL